MFKQRLVGPARSTGGPSNTGRSHGCRGLSESDPSRPGAGVISWAAPQSEVSPRAVWTCPKRFYLFFGILQANPELPIQGSLGLSKTSMPWIFSALTSGALSYHHHHQRHHHHHHHHQ